MSDAGDASATSITFTDAAVDVAVHDGTTRILHPTALRLSARRTAVIGANGSGKSTLARLCNGLFVPSQGTVTVGDLDTARDGKAVRRRVAFSFTDPLAQLVMPTVLEDVALSLRRRHRRDDERTAAAMQVLERFGVADLAHRSVHALSGGQRQLVALASVLATDPTVLVADEPTTLLDLVNSRTIADLLFGLDQMLVLVTHDLDLAARCDEAVLVQDGHVAAHGPPGDVIAAYRESVA